MGIVAFYGKSAKLLNPIDNFKKARDMERLMKLIRKNKNIPNKLSKNHVRTFFIILFAVLFFLSH